MSKLYISLIFLIFSFGTSESFLADPARFWTVAISWAAGVFFLVLYAIDNARGSHGT